MGNAAAAVKTLGFHVTGTCDEGGLAAAIHRFAIEPARQEPPVSIHNQKRRSRE
jgi:hypothetical protein